ncbi:hypothetical protein [Pararhizobium mangrovi]|uniref:Uncharacterized protein n=1 Tax=Pararhizobium mangrovi TaxID=2590452 RepID=A0A506U1C1_9HYPH|nr:hypothetical protein [Pararhizobium mangrovi]TPW28152.1 hypothetical protein FJU11_09820 [Pararhizobium mangrovi]
MKIRDFAVLAAAAFFSLAGMASVNDSEAINVVLPSQYQVIWNQTPFATDGDNTDEAKPTVRLQIESRRNFGTTDDDRTWIGDRRALDWTRG